MSTYFSILIKAMFSSYRNSLNSKWPLSYLWFHFDFTKIRDNIRNFVYIADVVDPVTNLYFRIFREFS